MQWVVNTDPPSGSAALNRIFRLCPACVCIAIRERGLDAARFGTKIFDREVSSQLVAMKQLHNLFDSLQKFDLGDGRQGLFYSVPQLERSGLGAVSRLPVSIR